MPVHVTTDTAQTITGNKTFTGSVSTSAGFTFPDGKTQTIAFTGVTIPPSDRLNNGSALVVLSSDNNLHFPTGTIGDTLSDGGFTIVGKPGYYAELASHDGNVFAWASDTNYGNPVGGGFSIGTDTTDLSGGYVWTFGNDGLLRFPDGSIQPTAFTNNLSAYLPLAGGTLTGALSVGNTSINSGVVFLESTAYPARAMAISPDRIDFSGVGISVNKTCRLQYIPATQASSGIEVYLPNQPGQLLTDASNLDAEKLTGTIANARLPVVMSGLSSVTSNIFIGALSGTATGNLPLTGGTVTGATRFDNNVTIFGNLSCSGTQTFNNTVFSTTSAVSVVHVGSGPALWVGNNGTGDIASFYDIDANVEVLHVGGNNGTFPNVGVKTSTPNVDFTVNGAISASSIIYSLSGNSNQWNSTYSTVQTSSGSWNPAGSYLPLSGGTLTGALSVSGANTLRSSFDNINVSFSEIGNPTLRTTLSKDELIFTYANDYSVGAFSRAQLLLRNNSFDSGTTTIITPVQVSLASYAGNSSTDSLLNANRLSFSDSESETPYTRTVNLRSNTNNQPYDTTVDVYLPVTNGTLITEPRSDSVSWGWPDAMFFRDEANAIAQRNSINAQTFRVYNTFTNSSNYERGFNRWRGSTFSASISGTILTLTLTPVGTFALGQRITGASVTAGTIIVSQATGSLGVVGSTYNINISQTRTDRAMNSYSDVFEIGTEKLGTGVARALSLMTDGVGRMNISSTGVITGPGGYNAFVAFAFQNSSQTFFVNPYSGNVGLAPGTRLEWGSYTAPTNNQGDLVVVRDAANTLALRNSTNPQVFNVYNTYTDASNYERGFTRWRGSSFTATISGTLMTMTVAAVGTFALGQRIAGTGVTTNTLVNSLSTGTLGAAGSTYIVSASQTVSAATVMNSYSDIFEIGTEKLGAGVARSLALLTDNNIILGCGATGDIQVGATGTGQSGIRLQGAYSSGNYLDLNNATVTLGSGATGWPIALVSSGHVWAWPNNASGSFVVRKAASTSTTGYPTYELLSIAGGAEFRDDVNPQAIYTYNTSTSANLTYERGFSRWSSNVFQIGTQKLGQGVARAMGLVTDGVERWNISTTGHLLATADNTYDIGATGATRPRNLYVANAAFIYGQILLGDVGAGLSSRLYSSSSGVIRMETQGTGDFNRLQFGGTTSAFPSIKRSGATLQARLADDSAFAGFSCGALTTNGPTTETQYDIGNSGASITISLANGTFQRVTLTGNCTFTMPTALAGQSFTLQVLTGAGSFTAAFTNVRWSGGVSPVITAAASRMDIASFISDGTNWYGNINANYTV